MNLSTKVIREYVGHLNQRSAGSTPYAKGVEAARQLQLVTLTEQQVREVVEPFLYDWGWMWRVLGRIEYIGWQATLAEKAHANAGTLDQFRTAELSTTHVTQCKTKMTQCYSSFADAVGPIAAAKALHLFCPSFFPPWDRKIAKAAKTERSSETHYNAKVEKLSADDYYQFVIQVRDFIQNYDTVISELAALYGKSKVKIADECFWWATQRPLFLLMRR